MSAVEHRTDLLVFGYVRERASTTQIIPVSLINLFKQFYENKINWNLDGNWFAKFIRDQIPTGYGSKEVEVPGPTCTIQDIPLQIALIAHKPWHSNGAILSDIILKMTPKQLPLNMVSFVLGITIYGNILHRKVEKQLTFNLQTTDDQYDSDEFSSWRSWGGKNRWICIDDITLKHTDGVQHEYYEAIDLIVYINTLEIKYNEMKLYYELDWNVDANTMKNECNEDKYYLATTKQSNNWQTEVQKFTFAYSGHISYKIGIKPISLQYNLHLQIRCSLKNQSNEIIFENKGGHFDCDSNIFLAADKLIIDVIDVSANYDTIPKNKWEDYGFKK